MSVVYLAGCVIRDQQSRILLLHRNTPQLTQWELPGGKIEQGETASAAAIREVEEELGVKVRIEKYLGSGKFIHDETNFDYAWYSAIILKGKPSVMETETFDDLRYFSLKDLQDNHHIISINVQNFLAMMKT